MGMLDNIRNIFSGSKSEPIAQKDDYYERRMLAEKIVDSINKIKRINTFDSSLWNLSNANVHDLQRKSLVELQKIQDTLDSRLFELTRQSQRENQAVESLEATKWTGQKDQSMTNQDFYRWQNDDGR